MRISLFLALAIRAMVDCVLRIREDDIAPRISERRHRNSHAFCMFPLLIIDGLSRKSLFYRKLHTEPLNLSVLKLDGSCFYIEVTKTATVAELKQAVEAVFSHMPQKGPGQISWSHLWGRFCLCYDGQKLITDTDSIVNYGIKDGDQLRFVRHISNSYNLRKRRPKKRVVVLRQLKLSLSPPNSSKDGETNDEDDDDDDDDDCRDIKRGKLQRNSEKYKRQIQPRMSRIAQLFRGWFRLATAKRGRIADLASHPGAETGLVVGLRKIIWLYRRRHFSRRDAWSEA